MKITKSEMLEKFGAFGCSFVGLDISTEPKLKGGMSNPHMGRIRKTTTLTVFMGNNCSYENMVNKAAKAEFAGLVGEKPIEVKPFEAKGLWKGKGEHVAGAVVRHVESNEKYIFYYIPSSSKPKNVKYWLDGREIDKSKVIGLEDSEATTQNVLVDGLEIVTSIIVRTTKVENVVGFRCDGEYYEVE